MPATILAWRPGTGPAGTNLFSSPPPNPGINDPRAPKPPPLPDIPRKVRPRPPPSSRAPSSSPKPNPALKSSHSRTKYYKPVSRGVVSSDAAGRAVVVGESGVSYLLPGAPFEFQYSYSETPKVKPLAIREPAFLPFAPPTMNRPWTGKAPLKSKKEKLLKKQRKVRLVDPFADDGSEEEGMDDEVTSGAKVLEMSRPVPQLGIYHEDGRTRKEILGKPLARAEIRALVKPYLSVNKQVNLGRDGLTHNMLELIHCHWRRQEICKVRCRGVPTVDMDNVCRCLEEKSGGKIIYRIGGVVYLFRGRHYNPNTRPRYPVMLWKPAAPVYPKLIQEVPEGLTRKEAEDFREKGRKLLPICKLAKNGIYVNLVKDVRDAFEETPLVKIDCKGLEPSDYKKIGAKLKELVPCVLLSFDEEQILMWRGTDWKSKYLDVTPEVSSSEQTENITKSSVLDTAAGQTDPDNGNLRLHTQRCSPRMLSLWNRAIESNRALLLEDVQLSPDALLEKVEEFSSLSQAAEHSYPALILASAGHGASDTESNNEADEVNSYSDPCEEDFDEEDYASDNFEELESTIPFGSIPVDTIAKRLGKY